MSSNNRREGLIRFMMQHGWMKSERLFAMVSPNGQVVPMSVIDDLPDDFIRARDEMDRMRNAAMTVVHDQNGIPGAVPVYGTPGVSHTHAHSFHTRPADTPFTGWNPYLRLKARLNMAPTEDFGLDHCTVFEGPNTTFVIVVKGDKALILDDPKDLFPSDSMVARFRLFQEIE